MAQLQSLGTFKLVPLPPGRTALRNKWVFKVKRDPDGQLTKYKSRLTACGYAQKHGIDYSETYSPVARAESLRFFLTICAALGRHPHKMDVTGAFLYGFPDKEIYMEQAPGYVNKKHPDHVLLLLRNLYGLKQAPRLWHQTILPHLQSMGFASIDADPCIFIKWTGNQFSMIFLHVDDLLISPSSTAELLLIKKELLATFSLTDDGPASDILGIKLSWDLSNHSVSLTQDFLTQEIISDYNVGTSRSVSTPMESLTVSSADCPAVGSPEWHSMESIPYRELIGRLTNLSRTTRPDISYSVGQLNRSP